MAYLTYHIPPQVYLFSSRRKQEGQGQDLYQYDGDTIYELRAWDPYVEDVLNAMPADRCVVQKNKVNKTYDSGTGEYRFTKTGTGDRCGVQRIWMNYLTNSLNATTSSKTELLRIILNYLEQPKPMEYTSPHGFDEFEETE